MFNPSLRTVFLCFTFLICAEAPANAISCPIDSLIKAPENWKMTVDQFEKEFSKGNNKLYVWLTEDRTRAKMSRRLYGNAEIDLNVFGGKVPVQEVVVDFAGDQLNMVSVSIYNRADGGEITADKFSEYFKHSGKTLGEILGVTPRERKADSRNGLLTEGYTWYSGEMGVALLEYNEGALKEAAREFLRLRMARPKAHGALAASLSSSYAGAVKQSELLKNVIRQDNGDVMISNMPMVDQGDKGYCVVATVQRVFEYYGIGADMHQIAEIAKADPQKGTSTLMMAKELDEIDHRFKTSIEIIAMGEPLTEVEKKREGYFVGKPVDDKKFFRALRSSIEKGLPLLWSLELGIYPEVPQLAPQTSGGHMRLIIGYNDNTEEIIFTDSWGAKHEAKRMKMAHCYNASRGLFLLKPTVK